MDKLPKTETFPTFDPQRDEIDSWIADFQTWIEGKVYKNPVSRINWLLGFFDTSNCMLDITNDSVPSGGLLAKFENTGATDNAFIEVIAGTSIGMLFIDRNTCSGVGSLSNHPFYIRTNNIDRVKINTNGSISTLFGVISKTTRIINTDSPYSVLATDHIIFCDTDGGAITANLPAGVEGTNYKLINCGSSANDVTVTPNGSEKVFGGASHTLADGETINLHYNMTEGWW